MKYYLIEIREPTNNPGDWVTRKIFTDIQEADEYLKSILSDYDEDEIEDVTDYNEWDDKGPNWSNLRTFRVGECVVTYDEIDNDKED